MSVKREHLVRLPVGTVITNTLHAVTSSNGVVRKVGQCTDTSISHLPVYVKVRFVHCRLARFPCIPGLPPADRVHVCETYARTSLPSCPEFNWRTNPHVRVIR